VTKITNSKSEPTVKAGALMCPLCCVEYIEVEVDFDLDGTILRDVKVLRCPVCQDEQVTPAQQQVIEDRLSNQP